MLEAHEEKHLLRFKSQLMRQDLVVLDELRYVLASKAGAELLFDVIGFACERQILVIITNLPFENWNEALGSERLTGASIARLTQRRHILEAKGVSYRLKDARRRRRNPPNEIAPPKIEANCAWPKAGGPSTIPATTPALHF